MTDPKTELARIRGALEAADAALVQALDARAKAMKDYVALREQDPEGYHPLPSSADVIKRGRDLARAFPEEGLAAVLHEVLGASEAMIAPVKVAVPSPAGSDAYKAARRQLGSSAEILVLGSIAEVFEAVDHKRAAYGVVPLETSSDGAVSETLHGLMHAESRICAELTVPCEGRPSVRTRFVVIGHERPSRTGEDHTLLAFGMEDGPGALYAVLRPFAERDISLARVESRLVHGEPWKYLIFIELGGHVTDRGLVTAIEEARQKSRHLKVLGSYPQPEAA